MVRKQLDRIFTETELLALDDPVPKIRDLLSPRRSPAESIDETEPLTS